MIVVFAVPLLDKMRMDHVVGAIPVHLLAGIWRTLAVPITNSDAAFLAQIVGIGTIGGLTAAASLVVWLILRFTIRLRPTVEQEIEGPDKVEIGPEAYPEFGMGSQRIEQQRRKHTRETPLDVLSAALGPTGFRAFAFEPSVPVAQIVCNFAQLPNF